MRSGMARTLPFATRAHRRAARPFQGSLTPIDWNAAGEVTVGFMTVFEYRGGLLEVVEARRFRVP